MSAKGSTWESHKYLKKIDGDYYYPSGYTKGRTVDSLKGSTAKLARMSDQTRNQIKEISESDKSKTKSGAKLVRATKMTGNVPVETKDKDAKIKKYEGQPGLSTEEIENMALQVIRGNFGNGKIRKDLLGENYQVIQDKVNELMKATKIKQVDMGSVSSGTVEKGTSSMKEAAKKVTKTKVTTASKGIDMEQVQSVYRKKRT